MKRHRNEATSGKLNAIYLKYFSCHLWQLFPITLRTESKLSKVNAICIFIEADATKVLEIDNVQSNKWGFTCKSSYNFSVVQKSYLSMYGEDILCEISKVSFETLNKIPNPYTERCVFYPETKIKLLLNLTHWTRVMNIYVSKLYQGVQQLPLIKFPDFSLTFPWPSFVFPDHESHWIHNTDLLGYHNCWGIT